MFLFFVKDNSMIFVSITHEFCLVALSIQILKINSASAYEFPEINFPFSLPKFNFVEFVSLPNIPDINFFKSSSLKNLKNIVSTFDGLSSELFKKLNVLFKNPDDIFSHFKIPKFVWKWKSWQPDSPCLKFNFSDFNFHVENELFGQHIVSLTLPKILNDHQERKKPLLISFQGPTGCGKSFVGKMIVQSLVQEGFNNKFIKTYYGSRDFSHTKEKDNYRKRLEYEIAFLQSLCDRPLFIFEEVDKMVSGVIDVLLPFMHFHNSSAYTNGIFVFIGNSGAKRIEEIMYNAWLEGVSRLDMTLTNFSCHLKEAAFNEPGGLQYSEIINRDFIDVFLPFLPLEREHVKQCILKELTLRERPLNKNLIEFIADQFIYHPTEFELFSESGCKRVSQKVDLYGEGDL